MYNIIAIQTARANSQSIKKKNLLKVNGVPLFLRNILEAKKCNLILDVYCTTDDKFIIRNSKKFNYKIIKRPKKLAGPKASHIKVMQHAINFIEKQKKIKIDIVVILLGNTIGASSKILKEAIKKIKRNDCVASVSKFNMFNPLRAFKINKNKLKTIIPQNKIANVKNSNDKNVLGDVYFCNGNFWICKRKNFFEKRKSKPLPWMGKNIIPFKQNVFLELDDIWQIDYVKNSYKISPQNIE
jgi:CMP-N-acetylneuraminic acid synthetase